MHKRRCVRRASACDTAAAAAAAAISLSTYNNTAPYVPRSENKGLRLDAFICSESTLPEAEEGHTVVRVVDSYVIPATTKTSDHAPIALHLGLRI